VFPASAFASRLRWRGRRQFGERGRSTERSRSAERGRSAEPGGERGEQRFDTWRRLSRWGGRQRKFFHLLDWSGAFHRGRVEFDLNLDFHVDIDFDDALKYLPTGPSEARAGREARVMFLSHQWYIAAASQEIGRAPFARRIAGEPIVFWRTEDGRVVAFEDRCPHRLAPLSRGKLVGDALQCGYHGITFDASGTCIRVPGQDAIPAGARVKTYRLEERWGWIWLWLGEAEAADVDLIPAFHWMAEPGWTPIGGMLHVKAHYQLLVDNLLDLSHETFLHAATIGNNAVAEVAAKTEASGNEVRVTRMIHDCAPPPLFVKARGFTTNIDRLQDIRFHPPCYIDIDVRATPVGTNDPAAALHWHVLNALTPETESSTFYFWGLPRHFAPDDREMDTMLERAIIKTFKEDQEMLEAQQQILEERSLEERTILANCDAGASRARSIVARLARAEQVAPAQPAALSRA
jgi:phenylpropionate dioxygenase-like ring-hydroxylating dioxygenase large terminal subunit